MSNRNLIYAFCGSLTMGLAANGAVAQTASLDEPSQAAPATGLAPNDDIIVTAQRREQQLFQVPQSISVVGGDALDVRQARSISDYAELVPGLSLEKGNPGETRIVLRGINSGGAGSTVAVYLDDVPFGSSTSNSNGATLAGDFDTFDVERLEVLRGPQGTLYGSNSLGGVVKYVTVAPKLSNYEARAQGGVEGTEGGGTGYFGNAVVNAPLGKTLALRVGGFYRDTAGFIDAIGRPGKDINGSRSYGGRASLLFQPVDPLTVRLTAVAQNIRVDGRYAFDADPATLQPISADPFTGAPVQGENRYQIYPDSNRVNYRLYSGTLSYDFSFATLTSVTSWNRQVATDRSDVSYLQIAPNLTLADAASQLVFMLPSTQYGVYYPNRSTQNKFTQEVRIASGKSKRFEWLIGGYFTREHGQLFQRYLPYSNATAQPVQTDVNLLTAQLASRYTEYAGFVSGTFHFTDKLDLTAGGRYSHNSQDVSQGAFGALGSLPTADATSSQGVFTWSVSPRFEFAPHSEVYARVAKGYRPGGPNVVPPGAGPNYPVQTKADTLISYEAGVRTETADRTFALDLSAYYLDWRDTLILAVFQTNLGPLNADANGKGARSYGFEATATLRPIRGLSFVSSIAYSHADLRGDTGNGGSDGDQLPFAPRWNASLAADYTWEVGNLKPYVGGDVALVSDRPGNFDASYRAVYGHTVNLDGYATGNLRAGVKVSRFDVSVYVRNVTNSRGLIAAGVYGSRPNGGIDVTPIQPRVIGGALGVSF